MPMVIAHHLVWSVYGAWLPNDPRGSGSDEVRNSVRAELGELHKGRKAVQPNGRVIREFYREATPKLQHPLLTLDTEHRDEVAAAFLYVIEEKNYTCYACAVMPDHVHILIRKHKFEATEIAEHLMTASRYRLIERGFREKTHPTWIAGFGWNVYQFDQDDMRRTIRYIEDNPRKGRLPDQTWPFVVPYDGWPLHRATVRIRRMLVRCATREGICNEGRLRVRDCTRGRNREHASEEPTKMNRRELLALAAAAPFLQAGEARPVRHEFTRLIAHWAEYGDADYLDFVKDAKPEICQIGFYGGHFYSLVHTPDYKGYPAHFPVQGIDACGKWFEERNAAIHKLGAKVVGHFNVSFMVGEPESKDGPRGFFKFYQDLWNEKGLGPKPVKDPLDLFSRNADGTPMASKQYSIGQNREYTACLANPHWRTVMKAWVKRGLERGVDGYVANYFYRHNCLCQHCVKGFKEYLGKRFTAEKLATDFAIKDLKEHKFTEIIGWHDPKESTPLRREMLRWSQITCKDCFDEVFVKFGRSIKADLLVGQWNHLGAFNQINGDERCMLPTELWGKDEDYLWYSTGGAAFFTDLKEDILGEGTLQARYIRGAFDDKPYTLGKYESTRIRVSIAELAANGGAPMGFYTNFKNPEARAEIVRYYRFMERYDAIFKANKPYSEKALFFPRSKVHAGDVAAVEAFKKRGTELLDDHVLFDIYPDDAKKLPTTLDNKSTFAAPKTIRVSASTPAAGGEIDLHFVNYNRIEPKEPKSAGGGIKDEKPIAADGVAVDFALPPKAMVKGVTVVTPEEPDEVAVKFEVKGGRVSFAVPKFLVYSVARIKFA